MSHIKKDSCVNIVKQGYLFIKRPPKNGFIRFKSWHKRYFVLRDETIEHPSRLEMYQKEGDFSKNQTRFVLNLDKVIHVGRAEDSKRFRQAFMVVCAGRSPILLAEEDAMYLNSWLLAVTLIAEKRSDHSDGCDSGGIGHHCSCRSHFQEFRRSLSGECGDCFEAIPPISTCFNDPSFDDSFVKRYDVNVESTTTSRRNGIEGDYVLTIRPWGLSLSKPKNDEYIVNWPLGYIRKFKSESLPQSYYKKRYYVVTLELGRRCATGEGILQFHTIHGKEIIADMNQAICRSMSTKLLPDDTCKRGLTRSRQSLSVGSSQGSYCTPGWRATSKDSSSSLNIKMSVSRQSSGGNTSASRLMFDNGLHVTEGSAYQNGIEGLFPRSPLLSDSSGDSKFQNGSAIQMRASVSSNASITSSSSSSSSSALSSSNTSRKGQSSGESGQYVEAEFNNCDSRRISLNEHRRCHSNASRQLSHGKISKTESNNGEEQHNGESFDKSIDDRAAKAAAEGYLEVLPDLFSGGKEASQEELLNIYHVVDFSKPNNSSQLTSGVQRHQSAGSLGVNGRFETENGIGKKLRSPRSSFAECPDLDVFPSEINGCGSIAHLRKLSGSRKPPAPLPRPEHTMAPLPK